MKESLNFKESLEIDSNHALNFINHTSGRFIGEVEMTEYDALGRPIYTSKNYNDITLPGSVFILEQMFKRPAENARFLHTATMPIDQSNPDNTATKPGIAGSTATWNAYRENSSALASVLTGEFISDEYIFGFMVGSGGEDVTSIIAPDFEITRLVNSTKHSSFMPLQIISDGSVPTDGDAKYYITATSEGKKYYYAKTFSAPPAIYSKWSDGSGNVAEADLIYNVPIMTYAEMQLKISSSDVRAYFQSSNIENCMVNQIGLLAGKPIRNSEQEIIDFDDVKLVTCLNFKSKDFSNNENFAIFNYKIYCL